jgi:uncharacterized membrane protein (UPF0136 family)
MGILLAFAPFIVFVVMERVTGIMPGLWSATAVSVALLLRDALRRNRSPKVLEIGTAILFGGLAFYALLAKPAWSIIAVRLRVDTGLLLIVLVSILIRRPFTLQYAREHVARERWDNPAFVRTNYIVTFVWAAAFAVMVAAEFALLYISGMPQRAGVLTTVLAIVAAYKFTSWYPERQKA